MYAKSYASILEDRIAKHFTEQEKKELIEDHVRGEILVEELSEEEDIN